MKALKMISLLLLLSMLTPTALACSNGKKPSKNEQSSQTSTSQKTDTPEAPSCEHSLSPSGNYCTKCFEVIQKEGNKYSDMTYFRCDSDMLTNAYKIALADCRSNIKPFKGGVLASEQSCIIAGADYNTPWTRDGAINVWNAFALLEPEVSKNTLLSVLSRTGRGYLIEGQYWDAMIWAVGAYQYVLATGDLEFLKIAQNAVERSLAKFESDEFDSSDGLFRGAAVYGDGIAAYPDNYANGPTSGIESWLDAPENKELIVESGRGIPMKALSTNCVYYQAYVILAELNKLCNRDSADAESKAKALKDAINRAFWNEEKGSYDYLAYECDYQEAIGISFALLFGIADERQSALVLQNAYVTEQGIACVWPCFDRYLERGGYGRHAGTIWPHAQGFFARAAFEKGYYQGFENELYTLAEKAVRDGQFYEIYHPDTGAVYGGLQGFGKGDISLWGSCAHQTWSATAYLSCIYYSILGIKLENGSVSFDPYLPEGVNEAVFSGLKIGNKTFNIVIVRGENESEKLSYSTSESKTVNLCLTCK